MAQYNHWRACLNLCVGLCLLQLLVCFEQSTGSFGDQSSRMQAHEANAKGNLHSASIQAPTAGELAVAKAHIAYGSTLGKGVLSNCCLPFLPLPQMTSWRLASTICSCTSCVARRGACPTTFSAQVWINIPLRNGSGTGTDGRFELLFLLISGWFLGVMDV